MYFKALAAIPIGFILSVFFYGSSLAAAPSNVEKPDNSSYTSDFLSKPEADRIWWYMGTFTTLGHLVTLSDKAKGKCVWNWYFKEPKQKRAVIEDTLRKYPDHAPSGVVLALLFKECGKFQVQ